MYGLPVLFLSQTTFSLLLLYRNHQLLHSGGLISAIYNLSQGFPSANFSYYKQSIDNQIHAN